MSKIRARVKNIIQKKVVKLRSNKALMLILTFFSLVFTTTKQVLAVSSPTSNRIFGTINAPAGVEQYNDSAESKIGVILFASNMLRFATVIAGIVVMANFIMAGWIYITSNGDSAAHGKVSSKLTTSVIGLMLIVGSYTIAALIGLIIFGDVSYILNPTFEGVGVGITPPITTGP